MPSPLTISVTLTDTGGGTYQVSVSPLVLEVDGTGEFDIVWQASGSGAPFDFTSASISFSGDHTPLTAPVYNSANNTVTCTDTVSADGDYPYSVSVEAAGGQNVVWPEVMHPNNGDPTIHNKPKK
jgi:hypothetical protein